MVIRLKNSIYKYAKKIIHNIRNIFLIMYNFIEYYLCIYVIYIITIPSIVVLYFHLNCNSIFERMCMKLILLYIELAFDDLEERLIFN